jgi:DNA primase
VETLWTPEGKEALNYLRKERGLSDEIIRQFQYGYCPARVNHQLAGRIIMPLFDALGEVVAITTRNPWIEKQYQHWHEKFDKANYLYGLNVAKQAIRKWDKALVVEGQFDTGCLHSFGFDMTVGILGTAFSPQHIAQLARYCSEVYFLMDPDESGDLSIERSSLMYRNYCLQQHGLLFVALQLPKDTDPDDFVRASNGRSKLIDMMKKGKERILNG